MDKYTQLENRIRELENWKKQREIQQITFPLDITSIPALQEYFARIYNNISEKYLALGNVTFVELSSGESSSKMHVGLISVGDETAEKQGAKESSLNTQFVIQNQPNTTARDSAIYATTKPSYINKNTISVSSGGNTLTDTTKNWAVNELAGAYINIYGTSYSDIIFTRQIASNTSTTLTIDGTFPFTVSGGLYLIFMPLLLGNPTAPFSQLYAGGYDVSASGDGSVNRAIRIGYGSSSGTETIGIFYGTGSPEGVVTANVGSLFLRTNGSTSTTLYVKTSGTSNTGWTAK